MAVQLETELRKLPPAVIFKLSQILDAGSSWKDFMAIIPIDPEDMDSEPKFTVEHIRLIELAGKTQNRSCSEILFEEWGTSGKSRPSLKTLLDILIKSENFRAADYITVDLLKGEPLERPVDGPAAKIIHNSNSDNIQQQNNLFSNMEHKYLSVNIVPIKDILKITNNFDDNDFKKIKSAEGAYLNVGYRLGTGAFGSVYYGVFENGVKVAVKRLNKDAISLTKQFTNEIKALSKYKHKNLLELLGYCYELNECCLVYRFMENGSLFDCLNLKNNFVTLSWSQRIEIAVETCEGVEFLHCSQNEPLIHRDIKTANILLDECLKPKLGDFGLVKVNHAANSSKMLTSNVFGTSAYMAPETFRGDVSVKMDVFSIGVVFLELLTGLLPYDENRDGCDLVTYIEDNVEDSIDSLLDSNAGHWDCGKANDFFLIAKKCLEEKKKRPFITNVLEDLRKIFY